MAINEEALKRQQAISGSLESRSQATPQITNSKPVDSNGNEFINSFQQGIWEANQNREEQMGSANLWDKNNPTYNEQLKNNNVPGGKEQIQQNSRDELTGNMKENSQAFIDKQNAMLESAYQNQIAQLEQDYMESVRQGEMSVREAQEAFEAQKTSLHENAYLQAEDTRTYGSEMGLGNSQQMVGLQQSDNSRFNKLHGQNVSEKDRRVADIRTRLETIRQQKDSAITNAGLQLELGKAQAQAEGDMMYNDNMIEFGKQDYFANLNQQFDLDKMDIQQGFTQANMDKAFDNDTKLAMQQFNQDLEKIREQSARKIEEMSAGHGFDIKVMEKQLLNDLEMERQKFANQITLNSTSGGGGGSTWKSGGQAAYNKYSAGASKDSANYLAGLQAEHDQALQWFKESNDPNSEGYQEMEKAFKIEAERKRQAQLADHMAMNKLKDAQEIAKNTVAVAPTAPKYTSSSGTGNFGGIGKYVTSSASTSKVSPTYAAQLKKYKEEQAKIAAANKVIVEAKYGKSTSYAPAKQTAAEKKKSQGSGGKQTK